MSNAPPRPELQPPKNDQIGIARMRDDGTIELHLVATSTGGAVGDALILVSPSEERYASIREHVGEIPPGRAVPVRPFPEKEEDEYDWE